MSSLPDGFRLLLDQGFPKPTSFFVAALDRSVAFHDPKETLGSEARQRGVSARQVHREAAAEIANWLRLVDEDPNRFHELLRLR